MIKVSFYENIDDKLLKFAEFETELHSEIEKIIISENLPEKWTYPLIQPKLLKEAERRGILK